MRIAKTTTSALVPSEVVLVERREDPSDLVLHPEEHALLAGAVDKRRREFATVRLCAREALARIGVETGPILPGDQGAPRWPCGVVGSMTHCEGYRAAAVALAACVASLGIDADLNQPLPDGIAGMVTIPEERGALAHLAGDDPAVAWDRLLFSAKESVYKTWFPLTGRWLGFEECRIELDPGGTFTARLLVPGPVVRGERLDVLHGRWQTSGAVLITAIVLTGRCSDDGT